MGEFVTIARVVKTQGRMGEVAADIHTDFPELFAQRRRLFLLDVSGSRRELHLEDFWQHKQRVVLKFAGIDSISDAEPFIGGEVQIPKEERALLDEGSSYVADLVGCRVFVCDLRPATSDLPPNQPREIGTIGNVTFGAGEAPILEVRDGRREYLIPLAQEYIRLMDTAAKRIELSLPEGMLELDAPLTSEEKDSQMNSGS